jgi:hypothetical protein
MALPASASAGHNGVVNTIIGNGKPARRNPSRLRSLLAVVVAAVGGLLVTLICVRHEPALLAGQAVPDAAAEREAARLLTKSVSLHAAAGRKGAWDAIFTDSEVNGWLATDLPRNHPRLIPAGMSAPRVRFTRDRLAGGARLHWGPLSAFGWVDFEVRLRGGNQLSLAPRDARLGLVPLPRGLVLTRVARAIAATGAVTEIRRLDGEPVLFVSLPSMGGSSAARLRLESLHLDAGEIILAGLTTD